jgi:hypothetical protein
MGYREGGEWGLGNTHGFGSWNRRVRVPHLRPRDLPAFYHDFRLRPEPRGFPKHQIRQLSLLHGTNKVTHPVRDRGVYGVLGDVPLDAEVVVG